MALAQTPREELSRDDIDGLCQLASKLLNKVTKTQEVSKKRGKSCELRDPRCVRRRRRSDQVSACRQSTAKRQPHWREVFEYSRNVEPRLRKAHQRWPALSPYPSDDRGRGVRRLITRKWPNSACCKFGARRMRKRIGKLQRQCRRAFWTANVSEQPTMQLVAWCYVRSPRPLATWQREAICRAVRRWADRVRRDNREWVWRLKSAS